MPRTKLSEEERKARAREAARQWRAKNPEKVRAAARRVYRKRKEADNACLFFQAAQAVKSLSKLIHDAKSETQ